MLLREKRLHTWIRDRVEESPSIAVKGVYAGLDRAGLVEPLLSNHSKTTFKPRHVVRQRPLWRTLLDVNRTVFYSDKEGNIPRYDPRNATFADG